MAKKIKPVNAEELDANADKQALREKVAEYMGPPPDNFSNELPANRPKPKENPLLKTEVESEAKPPKPAGNELLPSNKIPESVRGTAEAPEEAVSETDNSSIGDSAAETDPATNKAVDEIIAAESDQVLAAEDQAKQTADTGQKSGLKARLKNFLSAWWGNPKYRKLTLIGLAVILVGLLAIPPSRYFVLNAVGVRAGTSLTVLDASTGQPLKNVKVRAGGGSGQTDKDGKVTLTRLKLGPSQLEVEKLAFAKSQQKITLGWGSNPLGDIKLVPTGAQYAFLVSDWLSDKPIPGAEVISGESSAVSDKDGKILLTVAKTDEADLTVLLASEDYRTEELTIAAGSTDERTIKMVPGFKHVFVSKRSGKFDVFKIDVDGQNEETLLAATGSERPDIGLSVNPTSEVVAYVSTRDNKRNQDGFLLSQLYLIDIKTGQTILLSSSEQISIIDWVGDRLVYAKIAEGTSGNNPKRHRLIAYDFITEESQELASSNYFNDVMSLGSAVYYAPSAAYQPSDNIGLFRVNADGSNRQTILSQETWNILRAAYDKLNLSTSDDWYEYTTSEREAKKAPGPPSSMRNRFYQNNPDNSLSLWIDERDGQSVLLAYEIATTTDKIIKTEKGISRPLRWLSNKHLIYRLNNGRETADYVINLDGGEAQKIRDVTDTSGLDSWYFY